MSRRCGNGSRAGSTAVLLQRCLAAGLARVDGQRAVRTALADRVPPGRVGLVAIGKAAEAMAAGAIEAWGEAIGPGLVIGKGGPTAVTLAEDRLDAAWRSRLTVCYGSHPIPDETSLAAGEALVRLLQGRTDPDLWLMLFSGGASSLVEVPAPGVDLDCLARVNAWLLASGLPIETINPLRARLSRIKGGGLLDYLNGATALGLAISDVPDDAPELIGSGPLTPMRGEADVPTDAPGAVRVCFARAGVPASRTADVPVEVAIVARLADAISAAAAQAEALRCDADWDVHVHTALLSGDSEVAGRRCVESLRAGPPGVHIWGGETTVRLPDPAGVGGRNQHLALAAAIAGDGQPGWALLAAGSDGNDGNTAYAGALVDGGTAALMRGAGVEPRQHLVGADSSSALRRVGATLATGPTGTNVRDLIVGWSAPG